MTRPVSLRLKLLLLLLGIVAAAWAATAALSYFDARHEMDEIFDAQLAQSAKVLLAQAAHDIEDLRDERDGVAMEIRTGDHKYERKLAFQVWDDRGRLLVRSERAPHMPLSPDYAAAGPDHAPLDEDDRHPDGTPRGRFDDVLIDGHSWRVFSHWDEDGEVLVQMGEQAEIRQDLATDVALQLLTPLAVALPLLGMLIWLAVGRSLAPLRRLGREVSARDPGNLAPLENRDVPAEIAPLVNSLNTLLARLGDALDNERRFTADAAHELRTPLAALKTHAQVALRASDEAGRRTALENMVTGADRAAHLVEQLLTLARLDPEAGVAAAEPFALAPLARQILSDLAPAALSKDIELELDAAAEGPVQGKPAMVAILLRNLVDNAVRYTPAGGTVKVAVQEEGNTVKLTVTDTGPGIPAEERQRVFDRFYRVLGNEAPGSGLGLSIAKRIADLHRADLALTEGEGGHGLRVAIRFPKSA